jgi:hypothetical protein
MGLYYLLQIMLSVEGVENIDTSHACFVISVTNNVSNRTFLTTVLS